jgi:long-chain acyl-CoA synthetase
LYLFGRSDDVINIGGEKVSPAEIEDIAYTHPDVKECCCIGVSDPEKILGEVPVLFVVLKEKTNATNEQLFDYFLDRLSSKKMPYRIIKTDKIPKSDIGKMLRRELVNIWKDKYQGEKA